MIYRTLIGTLLIAGLAAAAQAGSAKILLYHHVSAGTPPSTSVSAASFEGHLALLEREGYDVVPLQQIADALLAGSDLDSRQVAITFDDAYRSVLSTAAPLLQARGWPFTVFATTDYIDSGSDLYLNWDELRALEAAGGRIGNHSSSHAHLVRHNPGESENDWKDRIAADVMQAQRRLDAELEQPLRMFAYPYGEFDESLAALMISLGFVAFGQQSGPVGAGINPYAIPRFPFATGFDGIDRVAEKLRTEYLPLTDSPVPGATIAMDAPAPVLELHLGSSVDRPEQITCFVNGQPGVLVRWIDRASGKVEVEASRNLEPGRSKYTCTAPVRGRSGVYYWYSYLWMKPLPDGSWYSD